MGRLIEGAFSEVEKKLFTKRVLSELRTLGFCSKIVYVYKRIAEETKRESSLGLGAKVSLPHDKICS